MSTRQMYMMNFVRRQAIDTEKSGNAKIAACIAIKNQIISVGANSLRTHPMAVKYCRHKDAIYLHAEISAISRALNHISKNDLKRATLYIHRVKRPTAFSSDWVDGLSLPCKGCMSAIAAFEIKKVVYSTDTNGVYEAL